jgi:HK97 family phage prohead protease
VINTIPWLAGVPAAEWRAAAAHERCATRGRQAIGNIGYRAPSDRPRSRRSGEDHRSGPRVSARIQGLAIREADGGNLAFEGYASVTDTAYEMWDYFGPYTEQVSSGAFAESLARPDLDVPLVLQHADLRRIARTTNGSLQLHEDDQGLHTLAPSLDPGDSDVAYIVPKLRSGLVDEMSFKFMITLGSWSPDWMEYHIQGADIHRGDVAIVGYGANPYTAGSGLRTAPAPLPAVDTMPEAEALELFARLGQRLVGTTVARGVGVHVPTVATIVTDEDVRIRTLD